MTLINHAPYIAASAIFCIGLYGVIASSNLVKKLLALGLVQSAVIILFISIGKVSGGQPPLLQHSPPYANPLPHVLMLTAIVVGLATLAVGLALVTRIKGEGEE